MIRKSNTLLKTHSNSLRPRLELLEERSTPSNTAVQYGTGVYMTGDNTMNTIHAVANDRGVVVTFDGQQKSFTGVDELLVTVNGGADTVLIECLYFPVDLSAESLKVVRVDLGSGDDGAIIIIGGRPLREATMTINVAGGAGNDVMISEENDFQGDLSLTMTGDSGNDRMISDENNGQGSRVYVSHGGAGNDVMISEENEFQGDLSLSMDGGGGDDVTISDENEFQGDLLAVMRGGAGSDVMISEENEFQEDLAIALDGGGGNDSVAARVGFNPQPDPPGGPDVLTITTTRGCVRGSRFPSHARSQ